MPSWQPERFWHPVHVMSLPSEERWSLAEGQLLGLSSPCWRLLASIRVWESPSSWSTRGAIIICFPGRDVSLTLSSGTAVGATQAALSFCQAGQWSGEVTAVTFGSIDWRAHDMIGCQAILALNDPAIRSVGVAIWPRLLLGEDWASASRRCVRRLRGSSSETWIFRGRLPLPEAGLERGEVVSLEWTESWLNRTHQAFSA
jgi:hypothetical protein